MATSLRTEVSTAQLALCLLFCGRGIGVLSRLYDRLSRGRACGIMLVACLALASVVSIGQRHHSLLQPR